MNVYEAKHDGHWLGGISVIVADDQEQAEQLLVAELAAHGLSTKDAKIVRRLNTEQPRCFVLSDGDY